MSGFTLTYRKIWESDLFKGNAERVGVWQWLIHNAAWQATEHDVFGIKVQLRRGQVCVSQRQICEATGITRQRLRTFLKALEANHALTQQSTQGLTQGKMVLTICNYDKYQAEKKTPTQQSTQGLTTNQPIKERNIKPISEEIGHGSADAIIDPLKVVFDEGVRFMATRNIPERQARNVIGKWRKDHPVDDIAKAISSAARESAVDPISYIQACLGRAKTKAETPKDGDTRISTRGEHEVFNAFNGWMVERW